jgi:beta-glucosidase
MRRLTVAPSIGVIAALVLSSAGLVAQDRPIGSQKSEARIEQLLTQLTLEEKISLLGGTGFETKPIPRLGIPPLNMTDGPVGVRWQPSSAFPVSIMMAATWDPSLIEKLGGALGRETKAKGRRMLLGPCLNIHRTPFGGRNFESFGEDPYLAAQMAANYVRGVQSEKVVATAKHFACNNQEHEREFTNVTVGERALREIYLPTFEAAVKEGGAMSVMSAYNKLNGFWCSENPRLLTDILKKEWGFQGFVVSDWGAVHSTVPTANAGLDIEMPTGVYLNADSLLPAITAGKVSVATIDDKIRRLLRTMAWAGLLDGIEAQGALNTPEHRQLAFDVAAEGIVLLKNEGNFLPLDRTKLKSVAVLGPNAGIARTGGGGSSKVDPIYAVSVVDGLKKALGKNVQIRFAAGCRTLDALEPFKPGALLPPGAAPGARGLRGEYFANANLEGTPILTRVDPAVDFNWGGDAPAPTVPADNFSVRWTGTLIGQVTGKYALRTISDDGVRVYLDNKLVIDDWTDHGATPREYLMDFEAGKKYDVRIEYFDHGGSAIMRLGLAEGPDKMLAEAVAQARDASAVVLCLGSTEYTESEGFDREHLTLPEDQLNLLTSVAAVNKNTIVVINSGAPVLVDPWISSVPALLESWFPGEEGGNALAGVLLGDLNPSGKLPVTFLKRWEDSPAYGNFPGKGSVDYAEGINVGYRHFDTKNVEVSFPFGFGLSYTTFAFSNISVAPVDYPGERRRLVSVDVKNAGTRAGAEVVQLYVHPVAPPVARPTKELKGFKKVTLAPGESKRVEILLDERAFSYYDPARKGWVVAPGDYEIQVGNSSRSVLLRATVVMNAH